MPRTPERVTVGKPHWPGYGNRNHGELFKILSLVSALPGCPRGRVLVIVKIIEINHIATIVSNTCI